VNSKQVVAALGLAALLVIVIYPAVATGSVALSLKTEPIANVDHVYVTVTDISAHRAGDLSDQGWELIENQSRTLDLVSLVKSNSSITLASGQVPVSNYDMIRVDISNVTWVYRQNSTNLPLQSPLLSASVNFTLKAQMNVAVQLTLTGQSVNISGTEYFAPTLAATASEES
jgi:hypothetical protein